MRFSGVSDTFLDDEMKFLEQRGFILGLEREEGAFGTVWSFALRPEGERIKVGQDGGRMFVLGVTIGERGPHYREETAA